MNEDFIAFSDSNAATNMNGRENKGNQSYRRHNNQYQNNWNRNNQRDGDHGAGASNNFSPHHLNGPHQKQNIYGGHRRYNKNHHHYNNQGNGPGQGKNNFYNKSHNGGHRYAGNYGQNIDASSGSAFFHPSMLEDPWKFCYSAPKAANDTVHANETIYVDVKPTDPEPVGTGEVVNQQEQPAQQQNQLPPSYNNDS